MHARVNSHVPGASTVQTDCCLCVQHVQGKGFQAGLVMRGMSSTWSHAPVIHSLEAEAPTGLLTNLNVFCARLWSRVLLSHNATGTGRLPLAQSSTPDVKAEAVDGYVR